MSIRAQAWHATHSFAYEDYPVDRLASGRAQTVSVCLPARNEATTIGPILEQLVPLIAAGAVDQIVVVDNSTDGTAEIARSLGAEVHDQEALLPELGPVLGKGDAMWRALHVLTGDIVCFLDADSEQFGAHYACGLIGPLLLDRSVAFVEGLLPPAIPRRGCDAPGRGRPRDRTGRAATAQHVLSGPRRDRAAARRRDRRPPRAARAAAVRERLRRRYRAAARRLSRGWTRRVLPRWTSTCARTPTSRCATSGRWPTRCSRPSTSRLERDGRLVGPLPESFLGRSDDGMRPVASTPVQRPPLAELRSRGLTLC